MVRPVPTFKKRNRRDVDLESAIIKYKSAIFPEHNGVPIQIVEPNPDSLVVNTEGVVISGVNINKRRHDDDGAQKKKKK